MVKVKRCVGWTVVVGIALGALVVAGCGGGGAVDGDGQPVAQTGSISGTVVHAGTGLPLGGIQVTAGGVTTTTANDGSFTLTGVPVGTHTLTITPDPNRDLALPPLPEGADQVDVTEGENTQLEAPIVLIDAPDVPPDPPREQPEE